MTSSPVGISRRPFRTRCELRFDSHEISALTRDVSATGLGINVPQHDAETLVFKPGMSASARFSLSDSRAVLNIPCNVAWVSEKTVDMRGEPTVALGLRFAVAAPEVEAFVTRFRHTLVLVTNSLTNVHFVRDVVGEDYRLLPFLRADEAFVALSEQAVSALIIDTDAQNKNLVKLMRSAATALPNSYFAILLLIDKMSSEQFEGLLGLGRVFHYLCKPVQPLDLRHTIRLAVEAYVMRNENERLNAELERVALRLQSENAALRRRIGP